MVNQVDHIDLTGVLIFGTFGMTLLLISVVLMVVLFQRKSYRAQLRLRELESAHQTQLLHASVESQEKERARIARDLHDDVNSMLTMAKLDLESCLGLVNNNLEAKKILTRVTGVLMDSTDTIRQLSHDLMPGSMEYLGLAKTIKEKCNIINEARIGVKIVFRQLGQEKRLEQKVELGLYRIVQELLNNALKHADAHRIEINMEWHNDVLELNVLDNGKGFNYDMAVMTSGIGLKSLETRAKIIGAIMTFDTVDEGGTLVQVKIGVPKNKESELLPM
ncbi:MAG: sensor histidine kinase [Cyclobacteriaceae bacterium]|nr:sensor histidine kinase [Cyclobacteriaceae bacterium]